METLKKIFTPENRTRNIIILIVLVAIIAGGYFFVGKKALAPTKTDEKTETASTTISSLIQVPTQTPGTMVAIDSVTLEAPGWVAIYDDVDGEPSSILGAYWFGAGTHTDVEMEIFLPMTAGKTYYATLRSDDGVMEVSTSNSPVFDTKKDLPLTDKDGKWIQTTFTVDSIGARG